MPAVADSSRGLEEGEATPWWEKMPDGVPLANLSDVEGTGEFLEKLSQAGDRLVVVDFYATWCRSCKSVYPKVVQLAQAYDDVVFVKVNYDTNKAMCKALGIKVLPYFHLYRGSAGRLEAMSASVTRLPKLRAAIAKHATPRCDIDLHADESLSAADAVPELSMLTRLNDVENN